MSVANMDGMMKCLELNPDSFKKGSPAEQWDYDSTKRSLDELFSLAGQYRGSESYTDLLKFIRRFRRYSPFNAMLAHTQMPGARYVAPAGRWKKQYGRRIITGRRPIVLLQPSGPVMFVFDVSDTEPTGDAPQLPLEVSDPFQVRSGSVRNELDQSIENAKRDGISVISQDAGSQLAGSIRACRHKGFLDYTFTEGPHRRSISIPVRYEMLLNFKHSKETVYTTLVHELAHLFCGHLGTPNPKWWPDRRGLNISIREFEAESVSYIVCTRLGIDNPSEEYLSGYVKNYDEIPNISLYCILKAGFLIEKMGKRPMKPRKELLKESA